MSIFIIYLKISNCQPLFSTNLLIIVSTAPHFLNIYTFWHFRTFPWLFAPNRLYYHHSHYFPRLRKSDDLLPPPTLHRSFSFATKYLCPTPPILYIYLCSNYYAISTLTCTKSHHPLGIPLYYRRTLWGGKPAGIGRTQKMAGVHPRARTHGKHARTRPQSAPNARRPSTKRPFDGKRTRKSPPPTETPRAYAINKTYITYFLQKNNNR